MKSAMQELIELIKKHPKFMLDHHIGKIYNKATELLEKEKQQLEEYSQTKIHELEKENERLRKKLEKEVCDHTDENGWVAKSICIKCGKDMRV